MSEDDDQRDTEYRDCVLERAENRVVDHVPGCAHHEDVAEADVEDDLCGESGVRAPKTTANGFWVVTSSLRREAFWFGCSESHTMKRSLPSSRRRPVSSSEPLAFVGGIRSLAISVVAASVAQPETGLKDPWTVFLQVRNGGTMKESRTRPTMEGSEQRG